MQIASLGRAEGSVVVTNEQIAAGLDTTSEWIETRTGITARRFAASEETTATLGAEAGRVALERAGLDDVDLTICCTVTPDHVTPATASLIQSDLGLGGGAFDLNAACSGWVYGLVVADGLLRTPGIDRLLLVGSETMSRITDPHERQTRVLFGDAAGAAVLQSCDGPGDLRSFDLGSDGSLGHLLIVPAGGSANPIGIKELEERSNYLAMAGKEVFRFATRAVVETCRASVEAAGLTAADLDLVVLHQANLRIITHAAERLGVGMDRVFVNIDRYGNTTAGSVPLALCEAWESGRLRKGDCVLVSGFGAGMSWASAVVEWSGSGVE